MVRVDSGPQTVPRIAESCVRLIRLFSMGATLLYPIVGLATATGDPLALDLWRLMAIGVLFHVYADMSNDVMDLPIDRTDPRRGRDPLVRGLVSPQSALAAALAMVPLMALLLLDQTTQVALSLAAAVALIGVYNLAGKSIRIPFLADLIQGAGWAALVIMGSTVGGAPTAASWWAAGFVMAYVAMINGVHGAVRDVENDRRAGASTTAVSLGARIRDERIVVSPAILTYAVILQGALGLALARGLLDTRDRLAEEAWLGAIVLAATAFLVSTWMLIAAYMRRANLRRAMAAGTWHLFLTPIALLIASAGTLGPFLVFVAVVAYVAPPFVYGRILGGVESIPPSTSIQHLVTRAGDRRARRAGLWTMTRIGVPLTCAMLVWIGGRLSGRVSLSIAAGMAATALAVVGANIFNDRCDIVADRINKPERPLPTGAVTENEADKAVLAASCASVAAAAVLGTGSIAVAGAMLAVGLAYSLVMRGATGLAQVSISVLFAMPIIYGGLVSGGAQETHWMAAGLVSMFVFARETIKVYADREGDVAAGYHTLATRFGKAGVLIVFRLTAVTLIATTLATQVVVRTIPYLIASTVCIVTPTVVILGFLRGSPDVDRIEHATARFGYVFAVGLVPLALMV